MVAAVRDFPARPVRFRPDETAPAQVALAELLRADMRPELRAELEGFQARLDGKTASAGRWGFFMMGDDEFEWMVNEIDRVVSRPMLAMRLIALCARHIRRDTSEVLLDRADIGAKLGVSADEVSRVAGQLVRIGVLSRLSGRGSLVRYRLNERIVTHASGLARDKVQAGAPSLGARVVALECRPTERRSRRSVSAVVPL